MDAVTLLLTGLVLCRLAPCPSAGWRRVLVLVGVGSLWPDVDAIPVVWDGSARLEQYGVSHTLFAVAVVPPLLAFVVHLLPDARHPGRPPLLPLCVLAYALGLFHLLLDVLTPQGVGLLFPVVARRFALDWLLPGDPVLWVTLAFGVVAPLLGANPLRASVYVVAAAGLYVGLLGAAHNVARAQGVALARKEGFDLEEAYAFPESPGGLFFNVVVVHEEEVLQRPVDLFGPPRAGWRFHRGLEEPLVEEFLDTPLGRAWAARARVMAASSDLVGVLGDGYEVWVRDLARYRRFAAPQHGTPYDARARFDLDAHLKEAALYFPPVTTPDEAPPFPTRPRAVLPLPAPAAAGGRR